MRGSPHLEPAEPRKFLENLDATAYSLQCAGEISLGGLFEEQSSARFQVPSGATKVISVTNQVIQTGMRATCRWRADPKLPTMEEVATASQPAAGVHLFYVSLITPPNEKHEPPEFRHRHRWYIEFAYSSENRSPAHPFIISPPIPLRIPGLFVTTSVTEEGTMPRMMLW